MTRKGFFLFLYSRLLCKLLFPAFSARLSCVSNPPPDRKTLTSSMFCRNWQSFFPFAFSPLLPICIFDQMPLTTLYDGHLVVDYIQLPQFMRNCCGGRIIYNDSRVLAFLIPLNSENWFFGESKRPVSRHTGREKYARYNNLSFSSRSDLSFVVTTNIFCGSLLLCSS